MVTCNNWSITSPVQADCWVHPVHTVNMRLPHLMQPKDLCWMGDVPSTDLHQSDNSKIPTGHEGTTSQCNLANRVKGKDFLQPYCLPASRVCQEKTGRDPIQNNVHGNNIQYTWLEGKRAHYSSKVLATDLSP